jgi:hypothetical protein
LSGSWTPLRRCPAERFLAQEWLVGNHSCARSYAVRDETYALRIERYVWCQAEL